jgi:hypothetical protein
MRQYHKKSRERVAGTDRRRDQSDSTILPEDLTNSEPGVAMTIAPPASTGTQIEPFRFPTGIPREGARLNEDSPATADAGSGRENLRFLDPASHNEATHARFLLPRLPPNSVQPGPTPPFPGASKMDASSIKLLRFCKYFPSCQLSSNLRWFRAKLTWKSPRGCCQNLDSYVLSRRIRIFQGRHYRKSSISPWSAPDSFHISRSLEGSPCSCCVPLPQCAHNWLCQLQS